MVLNALTLILSALIAAGGSIWAAKVTRKVNEVHNLVNSQHDEILAINGALTEQLAVAKTQPAEEA
jgi:hypothetical protein